MKNNLFLIIIFLSFLGCSSDEVNKLENAVNIFDPKNTLPVRDFELFFVLLFWLPMWLVS